MAENLIIQSAVRDLVKQIVLHIHELDLQVGDRLMTTLELREKLNCSDLSLRRAMDYLVCEGMVRRKPRQGTILEDLHAPLRNVWTVGVTTAVAETELASAFDLCVANYLRFFLSREGYIDRTYPQVPVIPVGPDGRDLPTGFIGLEEDIRNGHVDAVITPRRLVCDNLPVYQAGAWELAKQGAVIDFADFVKKSFKHLKMLGYKRIAYINFGDPSSHCNRGWEAFAQCIESVGQKVSSENVYISSMMTELSGQQIARSLQSLPVRKRPDGVIIPNDLLPLSLARNLAGCAGYHPQLVILTNKQIQHHYALPVTRMQIDCYELASKVVSMLTHQLRFPHHATPQLVWFKCALDDSFKSNTSGMSSALPELV